MSSLNRREFQRVPKAKLVHVKSSDLHVSKVNSIESRCYQLICQLFEAECLADEDSRLMPTDVSAIVHPSQQKPFRIIEFRQLAWQSDGAWVVETCWNLVVQALARTLVIEHVAKVIKSTLLGAQGRPQAVLSCPPSVCDASAHGGRFVEVDLLECAHARSRASSNRVRASTIPVTLCLQTVLRYPS